MVLSENDRRAAWPDLSGLPLRPTLVTLHLWTQVVGKVRLMLTPWENHGWHVPLYVSPRGLATGLIPVPGNAVTIEFDLVGAELVARSSRGAELRFALEPRSVADFHARVLSGLRAGRGGRDRSDALRDRRGGAVRRGSGGPRLRSRRGARLLADARRGAPGLPAVPHALRRQGEPDPPILGSVDLAVTRFSGRAAPRHPGGAPFMNDATAREAYSHEVSSAGFSGPISRARADPPSTATPTPHHPSSRANRCSRNARASTRRSGSSSFPTRRSGAAAIPTRRCSNFSSRPTRRPRGWPIGTGPNSSARRGRSVGRRKAADGSHRPSLAA